MLMANSTAIITDAFPAAQRGTALGITSSPPWPARSSDWCSARAGRLELALRLLGQRPGRDRRTVGRTSPARQLRRRPGRIDWWATRPSPSA